MADSERIAELERQVDNLNEKVLLLMRLNRINSVPYTEAQMREFCEDFQAMCMAVEHREAAKRGEMMPQEEKTSKKLDRDRNFHPKRQN